jgi:hypothetical protein
MTEGAPPTGWSSRALVVLGMHRSGTSALARCLNLLGAGIAEQLIPANWGNERGFWEDPEVVSADDEAFTKLGFVWHDVRPLPERWWEEPVLEPVRLRIAMVVRRESTRHRLWVVKDPRISRLLPLWQAVLAAEGCEPLYLVTLRHPAEVAASQARRDGFSPAKSNLLWLRHVLEAEYHTRGTRRVLVRFDDMLDDWRSEVGRIGETLGVDWPIAVGEAAPRIAEFLSGKLRHFSVGEVREVREARDAGAAVDAGDAASALAPWVHDVHAALESERGGNAHDRAVSQLDCVRAEIARADRLYAPVLGDLSHELRETRAAVDSEHAGWSAALEDLGRRDAELAQAKTQVVRLRKALAAAERQAEAARSAGAAHRSRARDLAERVEAQESRRVVRLLARFESGTDLSHAVAPAFRQLLDDSRIFGGDLRGYALAPSESLRRIGSLRYPIRIDRPGLVAISLAPAMDVAPSTGKVVLEVLSRSGEVLRRGESPASSVSESEPMRFPFPPLAEEHRGACLRVSAEGVDAPLRVFEWRRLGLGGFGRRLARAFCALEFADRPPVRGS